MRSRTFDFERYIEHEDGSETTLTIECKVWAGCPAGSPEYRGGPPMQPPEDPEMEILSITKDDGTEYEATDDERKEWEADAWENIPEPDYRED